MGQIPKWLYAVGTGWHPILLDLHQGLLRVDSDYTVGDVKEKFGGLRVYLNHDTEMDGASIDASEALVEAAEATSLRVCEWCGKPGEQTTGGWIKTLCERCRA